MSPEQAVRRCEDCLSAVMPSDDTPLINAMRYVTLGGGKRLRAMLVYATGEAFDVPPNLLDYAAASIECLHAYSLIHDDLPAMDDDDFRRGKPACHKVFGEAISILAGDALNTLAFGLLSCNAHLDSACQIAQIRILAEAAGHRGMVAGQSLDIIHTNQIIDFPQLETIHRQKTAALITAALMLGALPSKQYTKHQDIVTDLGTALGMGFQIIDDILDITSSSATLGKTAGKDKIQHKNTYPAQLGLEVARAKAADYHQQALSLLAALPSDKTLLSNVIHRFFIRNY